MNIATSYALDILLGLYVYTYPIPLSNVSIDFNVKVPRPQGFIVSEIINTACTKDIYEKLVESSEQEHVAGTYCVFIVNKTNIDTLTLAQKMRSKFYCRDFEIMGLKEAHAIAYQVIVLISCKKIEKKFSLSSRNARVNAILWFCSNEEPDLIYSANKFHITILFKNDDLLPYFETMLKLLNSHEWYVLNFFGYQRFGSRRPITHILGKHMIKGDLQEFLNTLCHFTPTYRNPNTLERILCKNIKNDLEKFLKSIANEPLYRRILELFVNAYQSYLFNKLLSLTWLKLLDSLSIKEALKKLKNDYRYLPLPGYATKADGVIARILDDVLSSEGIKTNSFCLKWLKNTCFYGDYREALTRASEVNYFIEKNRVTITFLLSPGAYATIVLRELLHCNPLLYT
uniref:tRNA pseudouridine(13) synthase TruD n=1 Tax=Ignisphaera aggregans TaxID=334771 RepID=A0A7J3YTK2_9CREN